MKILLIEDDADTAAYVADGLREHGHVVDHAPTAATACPSPPTSATSC